ncbi:MAG: AAA family ATPase [Bacteroidetes bacterium]|jgi:DNA polymerase III delta prime subunit|nr:AAA family ATPase [Bacteroidota bacterium]
MVYEELIISLRNFIFHRLEHYFQKREDLPVVDDFQVIKKKGHPFFELVEEKNLSKEEQLVLSLTLIPHLRPELYTNLIQYFLPQGGDLPVFGAAKAKNARGIIPTGETAQFILGGTDISTRLKIFRLLRISDLINSGIVSIEHVPDGEPEMSGKLVLASEYVDLFLTGEMSTPSFGPDFPAQKIDTERNWDALVLTEELEEQIDELKTWIQYNSRLMKDWEMSKKLKPGYRVLFHGPSGTGKTLTASLLGKYTGSDVFRVNLSTIVSKYIGETEKNLEKLFSKADNKDWILFFDEADSLFGKRTDVNDSHDRYANQEVSYLLQRVENFNGLVILSTNFKTNIDDAFLRRFNAIIKFPFPDAKLRKSIWEKSLPNRAKIDPDVDIEEIAVRYKLTGGNIINAVHLASLKTLGDKSEIITLQNLLHGIKREIEKEGKIFSNLLSNGVKSNGAK